MFYIAPGQDKHPRVAVIPEIPIAKAAWGNAWPDEVRPSWAENRGEIRDFHGWRNEPKGRGWPFIGLSLHSYSPGDALKRR